MRLTTKPQSRRRVLPPSTRPGAGRPHRSRSLLTAAMLWLLCAQAEAQVPSPGMPDSVPSTPPISTEPAAPRIVPPSVFQFVQAQYPQAALDAGVLSATVTLEITIDPDGFVYEAKVVTGAGYGFDEAALDAIRRFLFNPAMRDDEPIPARIRYNYVFEMQAPAEPEPTGPVPGILEGQVLDSATNVGLAETEIVISNDDGTLSRRAVTDAEGKFSFAELPPANYNVRVLHDGYGDQDHVEEIRESEATGVIYKLVVEEEPDPYSYSATARIRPPPREVTRRTIEREQLTRIAGTRGDALRTVELLAGVGRPPFGSGQIIVRGSSPQDSQAFFEGLPVLQIYHFGGLTSFVNSNFLQRIEFYPGNFGSAFGRKRGGVVEVTAAGPRTSHAHGDETHEYNLHSILDANLIDISAFVEGPISKDVAFMGAVRRSIVDAWFGDVVPDSVGLVALPVYYDYQLMATAKVTDDDKLRVMAFGSRDSFALVIPEGENPNVQGNLDFVSAFHRVQLTWQRRISENVDQDVNLAMGPVEFGISLGNFVRFRLTGNQILGRAEWRMRISDHVRLIAGLDYQQFPGTFNYIGPRPRLNQNQGDPSRETTDNQIAGGYDFNSVYPAVYVESDFNFAPLRIVLSNRVDYFSDVGEWSYDPRLVAHYKLDEQTSLKAGVGVYSQPPQPPFNLKEIGNPDLNPLRTVHTTIGAERDFTEALNVQADVYYKHLFDDVTGTRDGNAPYFVNEGMGRIYGMELQTTLAPTGRLFGYFSYTLSRSERFVPGQGWRVYEFDQTHILTLSASYRLGKGWEAGGTFRYVTGNPNTPVLGGVIDLQTGLYQPVNGAPNSIRNGAFHRLDLRIAKEFKFSNDATLTVYLDVQNAYNRQNQEGLAYNYDYSQSKVIGGLPFIPSLGLKLDSFL